MRCPHFWRVNLTDQSASDFQKAKLDNLIFWRRKGFPSCTVSPSFSSPAIPVTLCRSEMSLKKQTIEKLQSSIFYSAKYYDDFYEYRWATSWPPFYVVMEAESLYMYSLRGSCDKACTCVKLHLYATLYPCMQATIFKGFACLVIRSYWVLQNL